MNKFMTIGLAAVFAAGFANAQDGNLMVNQGGGNDIADAEASVELALVSAQVWRGQVQNEDFVLQPQFTVAQYGVSFNVWANYSFSKNYLDVENDLSEVDLSLAYTLPLDLNDVSFTIGAINYQFPANGPTTLNGLGTNSKSTTELFAAAYWLTFKEFVIPSATYYGDIGEIDGSYILFDIVAPYEVSDVLKVEVGFATGWGDARYNSGYWGTSDKGFNDYNFYGNASYEIMENLTASVNLTYTGLYGGQIEDAGGQRYEAKEKFWGGVNIAYDF
ncbi:hypothetical protein [Pontiella desulfatans]|nr:hypothetical protein [Pontiella desulfatans]